MSDEGCDYEFEWGSFTLTIPEAVGDLWYELKDTTWAAKVILMTLGIILGTVALLIGLYFGYKAGGVL